MINLKKALVLKGRDVHSYRITQGLQSCGFEVLLSENLEEVNDSFDIAFVDPSYTGSTDSLKAKVILFYDCEDSPFEFYPGRAYHDLKDKVEHYAKLVYVDGDREDGIKNIAFPIANFANLSHIAKNSQRGISDNFTPFFHGVPTWAHIEKEDIKSDMVFESDEELKLNSLCFETTNGKVDYNQRVDWILSFIKNKMPIHAGFVLDAYPIDVLCDKFGEGMKSLNSPRLHYLDSMAHLLRNNVCLCPTGHDRISWRTYDIMAAGSILFWTDVGERKMLYMPEVYVTVKDGESIAEVYQKNEKDFDSLLKESNRNRDLMSSLTPDKIKTDFLNQFNG
jgi:hypothetical protein